MTSQATDQTHRRTDSGAAREPEAGLLSLVQLFRDYLRPHRTQFLMAAGAAVLSSALGLVFPYLVGRMIDGVAAKAPGADGKPQIAFLVACILAALAGQAFLFYLHKVWSVAAASLCLKELRRDVFAHLASLPMTFFLERRVGELTSRLASDLSLLQSGLASTAPLIVRQAVYWAGGLVLLALTSPRLTLLMLLVFPPLAGLGILLGGRIRQAYREAQDRFAACNVVVEETLQNISGVKAFTNEAFEVSRYERQLDGYTAALIRGGRYRAAFVAFVVFALCGALVGVVAHGIHLVQVGELSPGLLTRFVFYLAFVGGAVGIVADHYAVIQKLAGAAQRVSELRGVDREPSVVLEGRVPPCPKSVFEKMRARWNASLPRAALRGEVSFEQVCFRYPSRPETAVLEDFSLMLKAGERVALVGASGAGKSTVAALLLRLYEPQRGRILVDGIPASQYALAALRQQMAVVPQEVLLFSGTIAENIGYGRPGAPEAAILDAARKANAHDFIIQLPKGYETEVGDRGIKLSGGQRQRVAIARAILRDPAILILDEATSALDAESENLIQSALDSLMERRTTLIIAHRFSTVAKADTVAVLEGGRVVERGTPAQLLQQQSGAYRRFSRLQFELAPG